MLTSIDISGFRGFSSLSLNDLRRVNLIVGPSASGKSALLEAVRLAIGATPPLLWSLNSHRGLLFGFAQPIGREQFESLWSSYFHNFDVNRPIVFKMSDQAGRHASVKIYFDAKAAVTPTPQMTAPGGGSPYTILPLAFERQSFTGESSRALATVLPQNGQIHMEPAPELGLAVELFGNAGQHPAQLAGWFSVASTQNQEKEIVAAVVEAFPLVTDLSVQAIPGQPVLLYASVQNSPRKLPISLVSSGITKFVSIVAAVRQFQNGIVLIDEIENGTYYQKFRQLFSMLNSSSRAARTQIFLTTHSLEFLKAASGIIEEQPDDFSLIQIVQGPRGTEAVVVPGAKAAAAIENNIEVRNPRVH
jgi:predicted ATPase